MPEVYQGVCESCGHKTAIMLSGYSAVWVDSPVMGEQHEFAGVVLIAAKHEDRGIADGDYATADDPRFVVLAHPVETSILAETGYSWNDLLWQGRYVGVSNVTCRECGIVFPRRRLGAPPATGCLLTLLVSVSAAVFVGILQRSFDLGLAALFVTGIIASGVLSFAANLYIRWFFPERVAALRSEQACPRCGSSNAKGIEAAKVTICPHCRTQSMQFNMVGFS